MQNKEEISSQTKRVHENRVTAYLEPANKKFVEAYIREKGCDSKSEAINDIVREARIKSKNTFK